MDAKRVFSIKSPYGSEGALFTWQKSSGNYIAVLSSDQGIKIFNRHGELVDRVFVKGSNCDFGWDKDGELFAAVSDDSSAVLFWNSHTHQTQSLDSGLRDRFSFLVWSKVSPLLAIGTNKGNLMIYNHATSRKIPILGKHNKKITCGCWSKQNILALGSEDKTLSISNQDGDTLKQALLRAEPTDIQFSEMKQDERVTDENTVSLVIGKKTLFLYNLNDPENPVELAFQQRYGSIVKYLWFGDGYILIGFSHGYFIVISTYFKEIGQELFQIKNHKDNLTDIAISPILNAAASCGDNIIKIHELNNLKNTQTVITVDDARSVARIDWSEDGQLLAVGTSDGIVHIYLTKLPMIGCSTANKIAYLSNLLEVTLMSFDDKDIITFPVEIEPSFIAIGPPDYVAIGMNNRAWFYVVKSSGLVEPVTDREYLGTIQSMKINGVYVSVLFEGKIQLHMVEIDMGDSEEREACMFPDEDHRNIRITDHDLTNNFLIYCTDTGGIFVFALDDWTTVVKFSHLVGIRSIHADSTGTKILLIDDKSEGSLFNPITEEVLVIPDFPKKARAVFWDWYPEEKHVFITYSDDVISTFVYCRDHIDGVVVSMVGEIKLPGGQKPLSLYNGELICQTSSGKIVNFGVSTTDSDKQVHDLNPEDKKASIKRLLALKRYRAVWPLCQVLNAEEEWRDFGREAMKSLDIDIAIRVFRHIGDVGMVWSLESLANIEDKHLLSGYIALYLNQYSTAQDLFLRSSKPIAALQMRRDLLHWDQALQLASKLAPEQTAQISTEYAQQLEFTGNYSSALAHYEQGMLGTVHDNKEQYDTCRAGIARMSIRCGDLRSGMNLALEINNRALKRECAEILENMKQYHEAAILFEKGDYYDKAAHLYLRMKNWTKVGEMLPNISSPKIHIQYAKAKEYERQYGEAVRAYEAARDYDNVVRIYLDHLNNPEDAVKVVKETKSAEGAKMVAKFFMKLNDYGSAIQFLVMSQCNDEAFQLARDHGKMGLYAEIIGPDATLKDYNSIALHFEAEKNSLMAGKFYLLSEQYPKAMKHALRVCQSQSEDGEAIKLAIDIVATSDDETLFHQLINFLVGAQDGIPKDPKYLFRLYMARHQYHEAAKTAVIIANEEQNSGNYRNAHDVLYGMCQELRRQKIRIPSDMNGDLMLLHSYILVRIHVRLGNHIAAARMLIRVANSISKFPSHIVPILTSTVIECHRSGLKKSSFNFATVLMRPEYRSQIDDKYKKKIEAIIRKPSKEEAEEPTSPCPYCSMLIPECELFCSQCKNSIPFCIVTGRHIVSGDLTCCPRCNYPAIRSEFLRVVESEGQCPMCCTKLNQTQLSVVTDSSAILYPEGDR